MTNNITPKQRLIEAVKGIVESAGKKIPLDEYWDGYITGEINGAEECLELIEEILR